MKFMNELVFWFLREFPTEGINFEVFFFNLENKNQSKN